jgi:hypothetical protein
MSASSETRRDPAGWRAGLVRDGYALFPNVIPESLAEAARAAIARDLAERFDPARQMEYDQQSYCPDLRAAPEIMALLLNSPVRALLDAAIGFDQLVYGPGQIAIRRADGPAPPKAHIDGIATPRNGVVGPELNTFTALVGVFLSDVPTEHAGNLTVWPGSHHAVEAYFRERGPAAMTEGMPPVAPGNPVQLICAAGDVVLCHYQLVHTAATNRAPADRIAVYFRLGLADIDSRRWHLLTNIWDGWRIGAG